jgi:hypothetical protein
MKQCRFCGQEFSPKPFQQSCLECQKPRQCQWCKKEFSAQRPSSKQRFCSRSCRAKWNISQPEYRAKFYTEKRADAIGRAKTKWFSERPEECEAFATRMANLSPEQKALAHAKQSASLKAMGWKPPVRGGNGHGPTRAEQRLKDLFPQGIWNYCVKTGKWNGSGYPPVYKVDVGFPGIKLAIEADGQTHNSPFRRAKDAKKTAYLEGLGWTVLRFSNAMILNSTPIVQASIESIICKLTATRPIPSTVSLSITVA